MCEVVLVCQTCHNHLVLYRTYKFNFGFCTKCTALLAFGLHHVWLVPKCVEPQPDIVVTLFFAWASAVRPLLQILGIWCVPVSISY